MKLGNWFVLWLWVRVVFGAGYLKRLVVFEIKYLCALYVNVWNVIEHDRYHQHAFPALSIGLRGGYKEEVLLNKGTGLDGVPVLLTRVDEYRAPWIRWIPRSHNHRMLESTPDAISITLAGPWDRMWTETFLNGFVRVLTWGRKVVLQGQPK